MNIKAMKLLIVSGLLQLGLVGIFLFVYADKGLKEILLPAFIFTGALVYVSEFIKWLGGKTKNWDWFVDKKYIKFSEWILNTSVAIMVIVLVIKAYLKYGAAL